MPARPDPIVIGLLTVLAEREPTRRHATWWWRGYITRDGKREKPVFGRGTVAEIQAAAMRWMLGEAPTEPEPDARSVRDACETWLGRKTAEHEAGQLAPASLAAYTASVRRLISRKREGTIGDVRLVDLDEDRVELYGLQRAAAGHAPKTINDDVSVLLMALRRARKKGWPAPELSPKPLKRVPKRPVRTPTREEILRVMAVLPPRCRLLLWLQYATGARIGEIAYLEWADVDLAAGTLALGRHLGARKTGERVVCLADEVLEELRA